MLTGSIVLRSDYPAAHQRLAASAGQVTPPVQRALDFIDASFTGPIASTELARLAGLSVSRFTTRFSAEVGVSPFRYVLIRRVRHAQQLLRDGLPLSVVAAEAGFFDQSHLCRHFRRLLGRTPSDWLRACVSCEANS